MSRRFRQQTTKARAENKPNRPAPLMERKTRGAGKALIKLIRTATGNTYAYGVQQATLVGYSRLQQVVGCNRLHFLAKCAGQYPLAGVYYQLLCSRNKASVRWR